MDAEEQNAVIRGVAIVFACGRRTRGGAQGEMRSGERVSRRGVRAGTFCTWRANENIRNSSRAAPNPRTHPRVTNGGRISKARYKRTQRTLVLERYKGLGPCEGRLVLRTFACRSAVALYIAERKIAKLARDEHRKGEKNTAERDAGRGTQRTR